VTEPRDGDGRGRPGRPRKPSFAERKERRAAVDDVREVLDAAARVLEARPRSVAEVRRRLVTAGYPPAMVEESITKLLALGYLDDEAFARSWVESRDRSSPRGEHALRRELGQKGVERTVADAILAERRTEAAGRAPDGADPGDTTDPDEAGAERLLRRRLPSILREPDPRRRSGRAYALLARSGFAPDVCSSVTRRVLREAADEAALETTEDPAGEGA
jgi:regulatory protein